MSAIRAKFQREWRTRIRRVVERQNTLLEQAGTKRQFDEQRIREETAAANDRMQKEALPAFHEVGDELKKLDQFMRSVGYFEDQTAPRIESRIAKLNGSSFFITLEADPQPDSIQARFAVTSEHVNRTYHFRPGFSGMTKDAVITQIVKCYEDAMADELNRMREIY